MNSVTRLFVSGLVAAACVSAAQAAIITLPSQALSTAQTDWSQAANFDQFDTSLGTLDKVDIIFGSDVSSSVVLQNNSNPYTLSVTLNGVTVQKTIAQKSSGDVHTQVVFNLTSGLQSLFVQQVNTNAYHYDLQGKGDTVTTNNLPGSIAGYTYETTSAAILNAFSGSGQVPVSVGTTTAVIWIPDGANNGTLSTDQLTLADTTVQVVYHYTPVPEPTTLGVLGLGAIFLGRRRHA